jgi:hypothetical protein
MLWGKIQLEECFIYDFSLCTDHLLMFGLCAYHLPLLFSYQNLTHNELTVTPLLLSPCSHCHLSLGCCHLPPSDWLMTHKGEKEGEENKGEG